MIGIRDEVIERAGPQAVVGAGEGGSGYRTDRDTRIQKPIKLIGAAIAATASQNCTRFL